MSWVAAAVAGSSLVSGVFSSNAQSNAVGQASNLQAGASQAGIDEQRRQFDAIQALLKPYADAGTGALTGQQNLIGVNGGAPQEAAINAIQMGPEYQALKARGENAILSNASATGGLRGGNVQASLAQFQPAMLAQLINNQFSRLGGLASGGQNAAAMTGNAGMTTGTNVANLLQQQGAAQAGGVLGQAKADASMWGNTAGAIGQFAALGGFGKF